MHVFDTSCRKLGISIETCTNCLHAPARITNAIRPLIPRLILLVCALSLCCQVVEAYEHRSDKELAMAALEVFQVPRDAYHLGYTR